MTTKSRQHDDDASSSISNMKRMIVDLRSDIERIDRIIAANKLQYPPYHLNQQAQDIKSMIWDNKACQPLTNKDVRELTKKLREGSSYSCSGEIEPSPEFLKTMLNKEDGCWIELRVRSRGVHRYEIERRHGMITYRMTIKEDEMHTPLPMQEHFRRLCTIKDNYEYDNSVMDSDDDEFYLRFDNLRLKF